MILKENRKYCSKKLLAYEKDFSYPLISQLEFISAKEGSLIPLYQNRAIHSKYYPQKEGEKYASSINHLEKEKTVVIALGFGAGYHLCELAKGFPVIAITEDPTFTLSILSQIPLSNVFQNKLVIVFPEELPEYFDFFFYDQYHLVVHQVLYELFRPSLDQAIRWIKNEFNPYLADLKTQKVYGKKWLKNALLNLLEIDRFSMKPIEINGKVPLLCGAGPSLEVSIETIQKYRKQLYLAAADTALPILLHYQIVPELVFSMDASAYSYYHFFPFPSCPFHPIRVLQDYTSPLRLESIESSLLFSAFPLTRTLLKASGSLPRLDTSGGNIGYSMIRFFQTYFPHLPLVTTGIDFGYYRYLSYSKGSYQEAYGVGQADYWMTRENLDTSLFYRYPIETKDSSWQTNSLQRFYVSQIQDAPLFTLSDSPFLPWEKITASRKLPELFDQVKGQQAECPLDISCLRRLSLINFLQSLPEEELLELSTPYFLAQHRRPNYREALAFLQTFSPLRT